MKTSVFDDLVVETADTVVPMQSLPPNCPTKWKKIAGNSIATKIIKDFVLNPNNRVLIVWGPTGVGKTSVCRLACHKQTFIHDLRSLGRPFLPKMTYIASSKRHFAREIVLIDPLEELVQSATHAKQVCDAVAKAVKKKSQLGFVVVLDDLYHKFMYPLRTHRTLAARTARFYRLRKQDIQLILMNANVMNRHVMREGIAVADGDGRKAHQFASTDCKLKKIALTLPTTRQRQHVVRNNRDKKNQATRQSVTAVDKLANKFQGCDALVQGNADVARSAATRPLLEFWNANAPHIAIGTNTLPRKMTTQYVLEKTMLDIEKATGVSTENMRTSLHHAAPETVCKLWLRLRDFCVARFSDNEIVAGIYRKALVAWQATSRSLETYSDFLENASFGDVTTAAFKHQRYALESTIAFGKSRKLRSIPRGASEYPMRNHGAEAGEIRRKAMMLGTTPQDLHVHVTTLQQVLGETTAEAMALQVERLRHLDMQHKRFCVSAETGMHSIGTLFRIRFQKRLHSASASD